MTRASLLGGFTMGIVLLAACAGGTRHSRYAAPANEATHAANPSVPGEANPSVPGEENPTAEPNTNGASSPDLQVDPMGETQAIAQSRPDGARCSHGSQCASGICEGKGCGRNEARCVPRTRACTRDYRAYCGCDDVTFYGSGTCPGRPYLHRGECVE